MRPPLRPVWSLPSALAVTLILLAAICHRQAISISDSQTPQAARQQPQAGSENQVAQLSTPTTPTAKNNPPNASTNQTTATTATTDLSAAATSSSMAATPGRSAKAPPPGSAQANATPTNRGHNSGRVRKPTGTLRHGTHQSHQPAHDSQTPAPSTTSAPPGANRVPDHIKQIMEQYSNTPPLFVTTTRDFFVDVASFPLGFKLATMQAVDSEGDRLEYSLQPASFRDASPYFTINATSGELRLANKRLPEPEAAGSEEHGDRDEEEEDGEGSAGTGLEVTSIQRDGGHEKAAALYFLNVAANDGKYTSVVELQIHVFNSSSFAGSTSSASLRLAPESHIQAKTREFFDKLYGGGGGSGGSQFHLAQHPANQPETFNNSTFAYPNFVNPTLMMMPGDHKEPLVELEDAARVLPSGKKAAALGQPLHSNYEDAEGHQHHHYRQQLHPFDPNLQRPMQAELANSSHQNRQHAEQMIMQQPMVLSIVVIVCSCLIVGFVLLVFIVPISVKRLKKRLKTMERQHEQLSAKASAGGGSSILSASCMSHATGSSASSMSASSEGRRPRNDHLQLPSSSLSQCTLSGSDRSCATLMPASTMMMMAGGPNHQYLINCPHQPLGRQSSLDSALSVAATAAAAATGNCANFEPVNQMPYYPTHQRQQGRRDASQRFHLQANQTNNGLNRINNGAIVNPIYIHQQGGGRLVNQRETPTTTDNIYCPIDDEFYSTINTESTLLEAASQFAGLHAGRQLQHDPNCSSQQQHVTPMPALQVPTQLGNNQVGSLIGQTCDSRNYLASGCAPQPTLGQRDTSSPTKSISSRSSTRSLARFLSLPARHWSHQQASVSKPSEDSPAGGQGGCGGQKSSFLNELSHLFEPKGTVFELEGAKTIARADRIGQEQQVRLRGPRASNEATQAGKWEIERHKLRFLNILDEGQFGLVWRCKLRTSAEDGRADPEAGELTVAVKSLKSLAANEARERDELLAEIEIMKLVCNHPNVVRILHSCTQDLGPTRPILLVMEYVELGNLQAHLKKSRACHLFATSSRPSCQLEGSRSPQFQQQDYRAVSCMSTETDDSGDAPRESPRRPEQNLLTSRQLIKFIYHVAKGMEHLASRCIVHRDLASRNILVSRQGVCKIGDFGMARHMANQGDVYERRSRNTKVPVRWMAPEVLLENSFTSKSDVFSFGILMWEIVTLGSTPYCHLQTADIVGAVARLGERPERPDYCHQLLYGIMSSCWSHEAARRPSFRQLVGQLDSLLVSTEEYIELDQYSENNYYNLAQAAAPLELL